ncbi:hypothetical protein [Erwinia phage vB_Ea277G]|jgi:hypothetical protein|nr:hypothetical protein [Erwinia phage vB_Ea277G]
MDNEQVVKPVKEIFNFIAADGKDLRTMVMEINQIYSEYEVQRNNAEPLISELERMSADVKARGVNRDTMAAVESFAGPLNELYPVQSYTQRRSRTNMQVAIEDIDGKRAGIIAAVLVAGAAFLYKLIKWVLGFFGKGKDDAGALMGSSTGGSASAKGSDNIRSKVGDQEVEKVLTSAEQYKRLTDGLLEHYTGLTRDLLNPNGLSADIFGMLGDLNNYAKVLSESYKVGEETCSGYLREKGTVGAGQVKLRLERIQEDTAIDRSFPGLKRMLAKNQVKVAGSEPADIVNGLKDFRAKLAEKNDQKQSIATDSKSIRKLQEGIARIVGGPGHSRNMLSIPEGIIKTQEEISKYAEKMLKDTEQIRNTFHESRMSDFTLLQDIIRALGEFQQIFNTCVLLSGWLLHLMRQFADKVSACLAFEFDVAQREAAKANMDASDILKNVTAEEKKYLESRMKK